LIELPMATAEDEKVFLRTAVDANSKSSVKFSIFRPIEGRLLLFEPPGI
jgi:hypothetical protein